MDVEQKAKDKTIDRADQRTDEGIDEGLDGVENGVKSLFKKKDKKTQDSDKSGQNKETSTSDYEPKDAKQISANSSEKLESYSKYDFIPGEKVIFYEDFSQDNVGDFPALWNTNGSAEVVTTNLFPGKWMRFSCYEAIWTDKLLTLPENYTIEFDAIPIKNLEGDMPGYNFRLIQCENPKSYDGGAIPGKAGLNLNWNSSGNPFYRTYINNDEGSELGLQGEREGEEYIQEFNKKYHIAIWIQKARVRVYQGENKIFDLPRAFSVAGVKMDRIRFEEGAAMISNIRVAVGAPDTRSKLLTDGKLVCYGIYFDVNKDIVKPESYGTLKDIATVLTENPTVKIKIIGHTDADGVDAANLDLSKRRAVSVKNELVKTFKIDASRIDTDGKGETQPVAPNDNPSNKALNRRVEFIKI